MRWYCYHQLPPPLSSSALRGGAGNLWTDTITPRRQTIRLLKSTGSTIVYDSRIMDFPWELLLSRQRPAHKTNLTAAFYDAAHRRTRFGFITNLRVSRFSYDSLCHISSSEVFHFNSNMLVLQYRFNTCSANLKFFLKCLYEIRWNSKEYNR